MDWLTESLDWVVPVTLVILFLFQRIFGTDEEERGPKPGAPELDEEARRVQEEIRRKIIARQQGRAEPEEEPLVFDEPPPIQRPEADSPWRRMAEPFAPPPEIFTPSPAPAPQRDLFEELRREQERVRAAQKRKEEALQQTERKNGSPKQISVGRIHRRGGSLRRQLLHDLSGSQSMKRAFLLKEIVDRPIGIRTRPDRFTNWD